MKTFRSLTTYLSLFLLCCISTATIAQTGSRDEVVFFFNDAQGSAVTAVNESGDLCWREEYTPYGDKNINDDLVSETGCGIIGEERGFTGHTEDVNSDLVYMQQRYYDPSIGRFLSIDPMEANPDEPMTYNRFAYANNNPYKYVDPDGRAAFLAWFATPPGIAALTAAGKYTVGALTGVAIGVGLSESILNNESNPHDDRTVDDPLPRDPRKTSQADPYAPDPDAEGAHTTVGTRTDPKKSPAPYSQGITYDENGNPVDRIDVTDHGRGDHDNPHRHRWDPTKEARYDPDNPGDFGPAESMTE